MADHNQNCVDSGSYSSFTCERLGYVKLAGRENKLSPFASVFVPTLTVLTRLNIYWYVPMALPQQWRNFWHVKMAFIVISAYKLFCMKFI